jgi:1-acyl-sn-glycerol-3-phosphate acyltransferase
VIEALPDAVARRSQSRDHSRRGGANVSSRSRSARKSRRGAGSARAAACKLRRVSASANRVGPLRAVWRGVRIPARLAFAVCATFALSVLWFAALPFSQSPPRRRALRELVLQRWSSAVLASLGVHVAARGEPPLERCFLVANHLSYLDILVIGSRVNCVFVSMAELRSWPFIGFMAHSIGTVFIDRTKKRDIPEVNREIESFLERGFVVVLFPEGRSSRGERVEEFRPSLLEPAAQSRHPVACATLRYITGPRDAPASRSVCWLEPTFVRQLLRLAWCERVDAEIAFHADLVHGGDRKELAEELRKRVQSAFTPMQ